MKACCDEQFAKPLDGSDRSVAIEVLGSLGCTKAQGYLISRPIPPEAMRDTVVALERMGRWQTREATAEYANATDWSP